MPGTSTRFMSFERLAAKGADGAVIVKLMMACNDMTIAKLAKRSVGTKNKAAAWAQNLSWF